MPTVIEIHEREIREELHTPKSAITRRNPYLTEHPPSARVLFSDSLLESGARELTATELSHFGFIRVPMCACGFAADCTSDVYGRLTTFLVAPPPPPPPPTPAVTVKVVRQTDVLSNGHARSIGEKEI